MANNLAVKDATGATVMMETTDNGGVHRPTHKIAELPTEPLGASADAAVVTDTGGTISGKMRGLIKWAFERMPSAIGQRTAADSLSVVLASDSPDLPMSFGASEEVLGFTVQKQIVSTPTVTVSATQYETGDCLGGKLTLSNIARVSGGSGEIVGGLLIDVALQSAVIDLLFFDADPTSSTFTDTNGAVLHASDHAKLIGALRFTGYTAIGTKSFCHKTAAIPFKLPTGTTMYAALVVQGNSPQPTYLATSDIALRLWVRQN